MCNSICAILYVQFYMCGNSCVPHSIDVWQFMCGIDVLLLMCEIDVWLLMCGNDAEIDLVYMCNCICAILYVWQFTCASFNSCVALMCCY